MNENKSACQVQSQNFGIIVNLSTNSIFWKFSVFQCTVIANIVEKDKNNAKFGLSTQSVCYKSLLCIFAGQNSNNIVKSRVEIEKA